MTNFVKWVENQSGYSSTATSYLLSSYSSQIHQRFLEENALINTKYKLTIQLSAVSTGKTQGKEHKIPAYLKRFIFLATGEK